MEKNFHAGLEFDMVIKSGEQKRTKRLMASWGRVAINCECNGDGEHEC